MIKSRACHGSEAPSTRFGVAALPLDGSSRHDSFLVTRAGLAFLSSRDAAGPAPRLVSRTWRKRYRFSVLGLASGRLLAAIGVSLLIGAFGGFVVGRSVEKASPRPQAQKGTANLGQVVVPDVTGLSLPAARGRLLAAGLRVPRGACHSMFGGGVILQWPGPGATVKRGESISLRIEQMHGSGIAAPSSGWPTCDLA